MNQRVIIVTGASRGIGRAISEELQARGAAVVAVARNITALHETANLLPVEADVVQDAGRETLLAAALERYGRIDGLVNNVGGAFRKAPWTRGWRISVRCWNSTFWPPSHCAAWPIPTSRHRTAPS